MSLKTTCTLLPGLVKNIKPIQITSTYTPLRNFTKHRTDLHAAEQENEKPKPKEVYYGILTPQIKAVKLFSLSSSLVGIMAQPILYNAVAATGSIPIIIAAHCGIGFFTFVTPFLLHIITKKYVTQLLYKPETDTYLAKTVNFFCVTRETEFKTEDVKVPDVPGMFTTLLAKGKPLFLDPRAFSNPDHYIRLMGYDKPIDFKLYDKKEP